MFWTVDRSTSERGITGLETAIILIAFVVVASVFAFTVLSMGIFASERSKETVFAGLQEAKSTLEPRGATVAYKADRGGTDTIYKVSLIVTNAVDGEPVDLTPRTRPMDRPQTRISQVELNTRQLFLTAT